MVEDLKSEQNTMTFVQRRFFAHLEKIEEILTQAGMKNTEIKYCRTVILL